MRPRGQWARIGIKVAVAALLGRLPLLAQIQDFAQARIVVAAAASPVERQAAAMLREEVEKRTGLSWPVSAGAPGGAGVRIVLADRSQIAGLTAAGHVAEQKIEAPQPSAAESFAVRVRDSGRTVLVVGADDRGVLFGVGYLLRHLAMASRRVVPVGLADIDSAPAYPVRGHQLGYRPKNNTFDGWTPAQFEQYIRDLAIFGTNTIELIPPRSDDDATSPLYTLAPMPMMVELSKILDRYGLDCSIWYPALDKDYADPATVEAAVAEWGAVFDQLPRIDAIFVPGGDPGHTEPKYLLALLEKEAARLRQKHPHAQVWVSPQSFSAVWMEEFYGLLAQRPRWLTGVVYGPEMRDSPEEFRRRVPAEFPIRLYPDITHVLDAQYPVPNLDPAFALTEGREPVNPRPEDESTLFHRYIGLSTGFVAYSEGSNDDVNKVLWSGWGWDPRQPAATILTEYARMFVSAAESEPLAKAIAGLEADWRGPASSNASIAPTLALLQAIEGREPGLAKANWRLQQLLYRGYYDAYVQRRARREQAAERATIVALRPRPLTNVALDAAMQALGTPVVCGDDPLCRHVEQLADNLFHSIAMQLSVPKYKALAVGRGANLDRVDAPFTDAVWLGERIREARAEADPVRRSVLVERALWVLGADAATGYDLLGDAARAPHLVRGKSFEQDPSGLQGTYLGVVSGAGAARLPLAWRSVAGTLYDRPLELLYRDLQPHRAYQIEARFVADARRFTLLVNGVKAEPVCQDAEDAAKCLDAVYTVGAEQVPAGEMHLVFTVEPGRGGNGRAVAVATVRVSPAK